MLQPGGLFRADARPDRLLKTPCAPLRGSRRRPRVLLPPSWEYKRRWPECVKYINPDVMIFDDDYGTLPGHLHESRHGGVLPTYWKELVDRTSLGMKFEFHSCGYITPLVGDFVDCGMDMLQPLQTNNDLAGLKKEIRRQDRLQAGHFDKQFDALGQTEEQVRQGSARLLRRWPPAKLHARPGAHRRPLL